MRGHARALRPAILGLVLTASALHAQQNPAIPVAEEFERLHFRSIGPAIMSGRISDLAVYEANPAIYYVATAHGGVWKTTSNGALFTPLFQDQGLISTGDVTVSQRNPDLVWVGGGESNNRQSTSWGGGVYKSSDGGQTFQHMGLAQSRHVHRIVIDSRNDDVVLVAATGPLFGSGGERGVYKTTDGGRTWRRVLAVDDDTGANDIVQSATNPNTFFASTYQRRRNACCMNGGGPGSGLWRSTDGGETWTRLSGGGLPAGPLGRIAVDVSRRDGRIVYATIEGPGGGGRGGAAAAQADTTAGAARGRGAGPGGRGGGPGGGAQAESVTGVYRSDDGGETWQRTSTINPRPMYFSKMHIDPSDANRVYMGGVGLHMSVDGGRTFETDAALVTHDDVHAIWINPANPDHILIGNDGGLAVSYDMSRTWTFLPNLPAGLFYHVSYDMEVPYNVCGGMQDNYNWCGPSASRHNRGIMSHEWHQIQGGDGFVALPDPRDWRMVYTESQNGNIIRRDRITGESRNIRPVASTNVVNGEPRETYRWHWDTPILLSSHDPGVLYVAANRVFRSTDRGDSWTAVSPDLTTGANRDTIRTMGVRNAEINLSRNDGISAWPTIVSLAESPREAGVLYTGTDDGVVSVTRDGGSNWRNVTRNLTALPAGGYVSEVVPSRHDAATVYVTVDNHLNNDYEPYIWVSTDYGATFRSIVSNLRGVNVRTLTEDQRNPDVLYIGTEMGVFLSLDRGRSWRRLQANLPTVRVDEITLHPRDNAMIVATHGRALWILDHLEPIQEYTAAQIADAKLFTIPAALQWKAKDDRNDEFWGHQFFMGENPPVDAVILYHLRQPADDVQLRVTDAGGRTIREIAASAPRRAPGIQTLCWDLRLPPIPPVTTPDSTPQAGRGGPPAAGQGGRGGGRGSVIPGVPTPLPPSGHRPADPCTDADENEGQGGGPAGGFGGGGSPGPHVLPGTYQVALLVNGRVADTKPLRVIMDPAVRLADADRRRYNDMLEDLHEVQRRGTAVAAALNTLHQQLTTAAPRVREMPSLPADARTQFESLARDLEPIRVKFGVPVQAQGGRGGGGGGRGGGAPDPANVLARVGGLKTHVMGIWEPPSDALIRQHAELRAALSAAIDEASGFLDRARAASPTLRNHGITVTVPPSQ